MLVTTNKNSSNTTEGRGKKDEGGSLELRGADSLSLDSSTARDAEKTSKEASNAAKEVTDTLKKAQGHLDTGKYIEALKKDLEKENLDDATRAQKAKQIAVIEEKFKENVAKFVVQLERAEELIARLQVLQGQMEEDNLKIAELAKNFDKLREELKSLSGGAETGKVEISAGAKKDTISEIASQGEQKSADKEAASKVAHAHSKITFSGRTCNGATIQSEKYLRLDSEGKLQIWERNSTVPGQASGHSWVKAEENNKQPYRMKYECLYQEADGSFTDASGKKVTHLDSYRGRVPVSGVLSSLDALEEGKVSGLKQGIPHEYFYNGAYVVFTKRAAKNDSGAAHSGENQAVGSSGHSTNQDAAKDVAVHESNKNISEVEVKKSQRPWRKVDYDETNAMGITYAKSVYTRLNDNNGLEIYAGKDASGKDIWKTEQSQNRFTSVYVYQGKAYDANGNEIKQFSTGKPEWGNKVNSEAITSRLNFDKSGIGVLPSNLGREHSIQGKQIIFVEGLPPGMKKS